MGIMLNLSWTNSVVSQNACSIASYMLLWIFINFPAEFNETVLLQHTHFTSQWTDNHLAQDHIILPPAPLVCSITLQNIVHGSHCSTVSSFSFENFVPDIFDQPSWFLG